MKYLYIEVSKTNIPNIQAKRNKPCMKGGSRIAAFELEDLGSVYDTILMSDNGDVVGWIIPNFATQIVLRQSFIVTSNVVTSCPA